jgi:mono/diheme cytochrome c family protein
MKNLLLLLAALTFLACHREPAAPQEPPRGNAERGKQLILQHGCNVCHIAPGVGGTQGMLGPTLAGFALRPTISNGTVANTPDNVEKFIMAPASMNPASAMPPLNVNVEDAKDLAAYLRTLK